MVYFLYLFEDEALISDNEGFVREKYHLVKDDGSILKPLRFWDLKNLCAYITHNYASEPIEFFVDFCLEEPDLNEWVTRKIWRIISKVQMQKIQQYEKQLKAIKEILKDAKPPTLE